MKYFYLPFVLVFTACLIVFSACEKTELTPTACDQAWAQRLDLLPPTISVPDDCTSSWVRFTAAGKNYYVSVHPCANGDFPVYDCTGVDTYPEGSIGPESEVIVPLYAAGTAVEPVTIGYFE